MNSPEEHETKFFKAEFNAMVNKRYGSLTMTMDEYINLFKFLQYGDKCEIVVFIKKVITYIDVNKTSLFDIIYKSYKMAIVILY